MGAPVQRQAPPPAPLPLFSFARAKETTIRWVGNVISGVDMVDATISNGIENLAKKVLAEATAKKVTNFCMRILRGLPLAASLFLLPTPIAFGVMATGLMIDIIKPNVLGQRFSMTLFQSIGLHAAIRTVIDAVRMASQTNGFFYLGLLVFDAAAAVYCYKRMDNI